MLFLLTLESSCKSQTLEVSFLKKSEFCRLESPEGPSWLEKVWAGGLSKLSILCISKIGPFLTCCVKSTLSRLVQLCWIHHICTSKVLDSIRTVGMVLHTTVSILPVRSPHTRLLPHLTDFSLTRICCNFWLKKLLCILSTLFTLRSIRTTFCTVFNCSCFLFSYSCFFSSCLLISFSLIGSLQGTNIHPWLLNLAEFLQSVSLPPDVKLYQYIDDILIEGGSHEKVGEAEAIWEALH